MSTLSKENIAELNDISIHESLNTHKHGKEYHHCVAEIGYKVNLDYNNINTIMRKLFLDGLRCETKILKIGTRELYAFIINNKHLLVDDVRDAMADESLQLSLAIPKTTEKPIGFPLEMILPMTELQSHKSNTQRMYTRDIYLLLKIVLYPKNFLNAIVKTVLIFDGFTKTEIKGSSIFLLCIPIILGSKSHSTQIILSALQMVAYG